MFNNVNTFDLIKRTKKHCDYSDEMKQLKNALEWIHKSRQTTSYSTSVMLFENVFSIKIKFDVAVVGGSASASSIAGASTYVLWTIEIEMEMKDAQAHQIALKSNE